VFFELLPYLHQIRLVGTLCQRSVPYDVLGCYLVWFVVGEVAVGLKRLVRLFEDVVEFGLELLVLWI